MTIDSRDPLHIPQELLDIHFLLLEMTFPRSSYELETLRSELVDQVKPFLSSSENEKKLFEFNHQLETLDPTQKLSNFLLAAVDECSTNETLPTYDECSLYLLPFLMVSDSMHDLTNFVHEMPLPLLKKIRTFLKKTLIDSDAKFLVSDKLLSESRLPLSYSQCRESLLRNVPLFNNKKNISGDFTLPPLEDYEEQTTSNFIKTLYLPILIKRQESDLALNLQLRSLPQTREFTNFPDLNDFWAKTIAPHDAFLSQLTPSSLLPYHYGIEHIAHFQREANLRKLVMNLLDVVGIKEQEIVVAAALFDSPNETYRGEPEIRYSFGVKGKNEIVYGAIWPLLEDTVEEDFDTLREVLSEWETLSFVQLPSVFPLEWSDETGQPLFPDENGVPVSLPSQPPIDDFSQYSQSERTH